MVFLEGAKPLGNDEFLVFYGGADSVIGVGKVTLKKDMQEVSDGKSIDSKNNIPEKKISMTVWIFIIGGGFCLCTILFVLFKRWHVRRSIVKGQVEY